MTAQFAKDQVSYFAPATLSERAPTVFTPAPAGTLTKGLRAVTSWFAANVQRRAVIGELSSLSDHELADIGLTRGDIPRVFDRSFVAARMLSNAANG
jgi:uncharacterized protein YjiS (DUF1127 family)